MKHLKLFESKNSENNLRKILNDYDEMCDLLTGYVKFHHPKLDISHILRFYFEIDLEEVGDEGLIITYVDQKYDQKEDYVYIIYQSDFEDLWEYLDNPDLYLSTRKYNI